MRYTYIFEQEIDRDTVQELVDILKEHEKVDLFFTTQGGDIYAMNILLHYLNLRKEDIDIYLTSRLISAGTFILTDFKGKIYFTNDLDFIVFHKVDCESYNFRKGNLDNKTLIDMLRRDNKILAQKLKEIGLTEKQLKVFNSGRDLILYQKDFPPIIEKINNR